MCFFPSPEDRSFLPLSPHNGSTSSTLHSLSMSFQSKYSHPKQFAFYTATSEITTRPVYHYFKGKCSETTYFESACKAWQEIKFIGLSVIVFQVCFNTLPSASLPQFWQRRGKYLPVRQPQLHQIARFSLSTCVPQPFPFCSFHLYS